MIPFLLSKGFMPFQKSMIWWGALYLRDFCESIHNWHSYTWDLCFKKRECLKLYINSSPKINFNIKTFYIIKFPELWQFPQNYISLVGWSWTIRRLHLRGGIRHSITNVLNMILNHLMVRFQSLSFKECILPLFSGLLWHRVTVPIRVPSVGQIEILGIICQCTKK